MKKTGEIIEKMILLVIIIIGFSKMFGALILLVLKEDTKILVENNMHKIR